MNKDRLERITIRVTTDTGHTQDLTAMVDPELLSTYMKIGRFVAHGLRQKPGERMRLEGQTSFISYDQQAAINAIDGTAREFERDSKQRHLLTFRSSNIYVGRGKNG